MKRRASVFGLIMVTILWAAVPAGATFSEFAIGAKVGTLGLGGEVTTDLVPRVNLRGSLQWLDFNYETEIEGVNYNLDLSFLHPLVMADWYVFGGSFRLSGGVLFDGTDIRLDATSTWTGTTTSPGWRPRRSMRATSCVSRMPLAAVDTDRQQDRATSSGSGTWTESVE
jgi:hypothetical protein